MVVIGHRGAKGYAPENTLTSFHKAIELGVVTIELDVQRSHDGSLVVIHDPWVNRTTDGWGLVSHKSLAELKKLNVSKREKIPTLKEVLDFINRRATVIIEIKSKNTAFLVTEVINTYVKHKGWKYSDFLVSSFNHRELRIFKQSLPSVRIGVLIIGFRIRLDTYTKELHANSLHMWSKLATAAVVKKAHKRGLKVFVYTVNDKKEAEKMKSLGVDGIYSDFPDRV